MCVSKQGKKSERECVRVSGRLGFSRNTARISCGANMHLALSLSRSLCFLSLSLTSHGHMTARKIPSFAGAKFQHLAPSNKRDTHEEP